MITIFVRCTDKPSNVVTLKLIHLGKCILTCLSKAFFNVLGIYIDKETLIRHKLESSFLRLMTFSRSAPLCASRRHLQEFSYKFK